MVGRDFSLLNLQRFQPQAQVQEPQTQKAQTHEGSKTNGKW